MQISVLLPTANRPAMLRTALRSIAAQTALSAVSEVVVIENLGNRESGKICEEFPQLPIRYVFRDPPIPPGFDSAMDAMNYINGDYMALLFDDDWWGETHLERSIQSHAIAPDVVASYGSCIYTTGEEGYWTGCYGSFTRWFASKGEQTNGRWIFELPELLVAAMLKTAFHYSSLLIKRSVWEKCLMCTSDGNPYDTDRLISVEIGRHGKVVLDSQSLAFIRTHPGQELIRINHEGSAQHWWNQSTQKLMDLAKASNVDLRNEFSSRMANKNVLLEDLMNHSHPGAMDWLFAQNILTDSREKASFLKRLIAKLRRPSAQWPIRWIRIGRE